MCLPLPWVGEWLVCIIHSVSPSTLSRIGGGAHLYHPQCLPLPCVKVGEGLICIIHSVSPSTLCESGGGAHLYHPQCVSLYREWRWGRGSFVSSTVCLPLPCVKVGEGLICIIHSVSPSTVSGGGGGALLYHPQCVSLYLE